MPLDTPEGRLRLVAMAGMAPALAHEVSQPLTAATNFIHASASRLRARGDGHEDVLAMIEQASRETVKAGEIIRRLRDFMVSGKVAGRREALESIVEGLATGLVCPDGGEVEIAWSIARDARFIIGERVQIEQVLATLLANACAALGGRGDRRIAIEAARRENEVLVRVRDTGPGLSDEAIAGLNDPSAGAKAKGAGLGLPIARLIVEAHGGRLWAESPVGGGGLLCLSLPAAD